MSIDINLNPRIPALPKVEDKTKIDVRYSLISPYASAHVYWNPELREIVYDVEEPLLTPKEKEVLDKLEESMYEIINVNVAIEKTVEATSEYIDKTARLLIDELNLGISEDSYNKIFYYLFRDFIGLQNVEPLIRDFYIEDIECNGVDSPVYVVHRVYRNLKTNIKFSNVEELASFVEKLAQRTGRYISYAQPLLDGSLPDGSRVNASYTKDVTSKGPTFCFKDGYVQLSDGSVKNIKKLFEEAKDNFGSKIEDGNEIVEPNNINCCGVEERDLQQKDSRIKSLIKVKAPEKLVKVRFEDGGDVEVTPDHLFHVAGNSLELIQAKNLKKDMLVPMPKKVNVTGYRQKINVYSIIKDFSYLNRVSIISSPEIKNIIESEIQLNNTEGNYRQILSQKYGVSNSYFYEIISRGNSVGFSVLDKILDERKIDFDNIDQEIMLSVYGGGTKDKSKTLKVPKEVDEDLGYLAGILISDGHIAKNDIEFCTFEEGIRKSVQERLIKKFGKCETYYDGNRVYLCNTFASYYFNRVFGIPAGKKAYKVRIPEIIFKSDNKVIASFIKGLFDGDGTVNAGLSYKTYSKDLAEGLTYLLARLGIYSYIRSNGKEHRLNIPSNLYLKYQEEIGFDELRKKIKLQMLIAKQVDHKTFIRHNRVPGAPILSIIRKIGMPKTNLAKICDVNFNRFSYLTFSRSFAKKLYEEIIKNEKSYLVKEELKYIEWLISTEQEFSKIESVEIIDNKEPVYDLELEPCKFFIAGNKPMNMFDTIRKFTKIPWTPSQLISFETASAEMLAYFWMLLQYKASVLIAGGTGTGKTTLLNAIAFFIPPEARVVSLEDTKEINLPRENWLPAVARPSIGIGKVGEIDLFALLKSSFRQNPDYLIVGEVRGKEAYVLFQGMASGHSSISTMHAESVDTLIRRLQTPPIELSPSLVNSLDCVAIMSRITINQKETRKLKEIVEIINVATDGKAITNTPLLWDPMQKKFMFKNSSHLLGKISKQQGIPMDKLQKEFITRTKILNEMARRRIFGFEEVGAMINEYYKNPIAVLNKLGIKE